MLHLRYDYRSAFIEVNEKRHAQAVMKELGIRYFHSTAQSLGDQFWFWCCENVPKELPPYLTELDVDPATCVGFGLSEEDANAIKRFIYAGQLKRRSPMKYTTKEQDQIEEILDERLNPIRRELNALRIELSEMKVENVDLRRHVSLLALSVATICQKHLDEGE